LEAQQNNANDFNQSLRTKSKQNTFTLNKPFDATINSLKMFIYRKVPSVL